MEQHLFWMSFVDPYLPPGRRSLGVCLVRAGSPKGAIIRSHMLGCNPGGELKMYQVPPELQPELARVPRDRLLSRDAVERYGVRTATEDEMAAEGKKLR